jgi:hypothetical protein
MVILPVPAICCLARWRTMPMGGPWQFWWDTILVERSKLCRGKD